MLVEDEEMKMMVIVRGKGTAKETRINTSIPLYWSKVLNAWVTTPDSARK